MNERSKSKRLRWAGPAFVFLVLVFWMYDPISSILESYSPKLATFAPYSFALNSSTVHVEISPDAKYILSVSEGLLTFWDPFSRRSVAKLRVDTPIQFAKFSGDGKTVIVKSPEGYRCVEMNTWTIYDTTLTPLDEVAAQPDNPAVEDGAEEITSILDAVTKRQKAALWRSASARIFEMNPLTDRELIFDPLQKKILVRINGNKYEIPCEHTPDDVALSGDGHSLGWINGETCILYDLPTNERRQIDVAPGARILALNSDSTRMGISTNDGVVLYDLKSLRAVARLTSDAYIHRYLQFAGEYLIAVSGTTPRIEMWKIAG